MIDGMAMLCATHPRIVGGSLIGQTDSTPGARAPPGIDGSRLAVQSCANTALHMYNLFCNNLEDIHGTLSIPLCHSFV